jgi:hypothetical protein
MRLGILETLQVRGRATLYPSRSLVAGSGNSRPAAEIVQCGEPAPKNAQRINHLRIQPTAASRLASAWLWKNGPVSADSTNGGLLNSSNST